MKKFLLSICCLLGAASTAFADEVVFDFVNEDYGLTRASENSDPYIDNGVTCEIPPITVTLNKTEGKNGMRLWRDGLRFYQKSDASFTVSIGNGTITNISFTGVSGCTFALDGTTDNVTEWNGSATSVKFNYTASANKALKTLTVTYTPGSTDLKNPELSFPQKAYTVTLGDTFEAPELSNPNNLPVEFTSSNENVATIDDDGYVIVKGTGTTTITATSTATDIFAAGRASYTLTVKNPVPTAENLADFIKLTPNKDDVAIMGCDLTVQYVSGAYVYVKDYAKSGVSSLIYKYDLGYQKGDVIPGGWEGKNGIYNGLYEIVPTATMPAATDNVDVTYAALSNVDLSMVNEIVTLKEVTFEAETGAAKANFTGKLADGTELSFRNTFGIEAVAAGTYNVTLAVSVYNSNLQLLPIEYVSTSAIGEIAADNAAAAEYFNIQGVSVDADNLTPGIYVRRQGNKVTKVIVK